MKLTTLFVILSLLTVSPRTYTRVTLKVKNAKERFTSWRRSTYLFYQNR